MQDISENNNRLTSKQASARSVNVYCRCVNWHVVQNYEAARVGSSTLYQTWHCLGQSTACPGANVMRPRPSSGLTVSGSGESARPETPWPAHVVIYHSVTRHSKSFRRLYRCFRWEGVGTCGSEHCNALPRPDNSNWTSFHGYSCSQLLKKPRSGRHTRRTIQVSQPKPNIIIGWDLGGRCSLLMSY